MWDLIILVPDHCLSFYFTLFDERLCRTGDICTSKLYNHEIDRRSGYN